MFDFILRRKEKKVDIKSPKLFEKIEKFAELARIVYDNLGEFESVANISNFKYLNGYLSEDISFIMKDDHYVSSVFISLANVNKVQRTLSVHINPIMSSINDYIKEKKNIRIEYDAEGNITVEPLLGAKYSAQSVLNDIDNIISKFSEFITVSENVKQEHLDELRKLY